MKKMILPTIAFSVILAVHAQAGKVVTYTATSTVSQEEANNSAVAGVAKQISSQVSTTQVLKKEDVTVDGKETLTETYSSLNNLTSDLKLKGVKIMPGKTDGKSFKATATLDLDEFTSDIQFQMKSEKKEVVKNETMAKDALEKRHYADAVKSIELAKPHVESYEKLLIKLSQVYPINESHRLVHHLDEYEQVLEQKVSTITISGPADKFELKKPEMPPLQITVSDDQGGVPDFSIRVHQGKETLTTVKTNSRGTAVVNLKKVNFEEGPYSVYVEPDLPLALMKKAGLNQKMEMDYTVVKKKCSIKMECKEDVSVCTTLKESLSKKSIYVDDSEDPSIPSIAFSISAQQKNSLNSGNTALISYDVNISANGNGIANNVTVRSVGKSKDDAIVKAASKADFSKLQKQLEQYCK